MEALRLICIPYAGAGANYYFKFFEQIRPGIKICPIELPGRGRRIKEPFIDMFSYAMDDLIEQVKKIIKSDNSQYALFGHSLGAIFAYEIAHELVKQEWRPPIHLFLSGQAPIDHLNIKTRYSAITEEFKNEILMLGGLEEKILEHHELMEYVMSVIFADFKILYSYEYKPYSQKLSCGITTFCGSEDTYINVHNMKYWKAHTSGNHYEYTYAGGHFFIDNWLQNVVSKINDTLNPEHIQ